MSEKKLLILGGKPIGSCEIAYAAKQLGHYVIVADYLPVAASPAKRIADESWDVSTGDIERLKRLCTCARIDGVLAGVHEFNLEKMAVLSAELGLPCYCTFSQQEQCEDKRYFKKACRSHGLEVAREYSEEEAIDLPASAYPLAVKPRDGSGSRGFTKCFSPGEVSPAVEQAKRFSLCGEALIEEFIQSDALIAQYTIHDGEVYFSGLTDKHSRPLGSGGAPVMALQVAPARSTSLYLEKIDPAVKEMLHSFGMTEGPVWIEIFLVGNRFVFNEIGYRFGGSLTYHFVRELYGIDQMRLLIDHALGLNRLIDPPSRVSDDWYVIWPLHLKPGKITSVEGLDQLRQLEEFVALAQVHWIGDEIFSWGSAQQVFAYIHLKGPSLSELVEAMNAILLFMRVLDAKGDDMLFSLFSPAVDSVSQSAPGFLHAGLLGKE